jgi:hypothetical protein
MQVRKVIVQREETRREAGRDLAAPTVKVVAAVVLTNPLAGTFTEDLAVLEELGAEVAALLAAEALRALGDRAHAVDAYGKAAVVGLAASSSMRPRSCTRASARPCGRRSAVARRSSRRRRRWTGRAPRSRCR